jgi:site-specific DNA recombinase
MRTVIYARKSTESEERQIQSLDDQIRECENIARRERWYVSETYQESRSAKEPGSRPEFQRLMADIQAGKVERVLTWSITRLSRNPVDGGLVAYLLQTGKLQEIRTAERSYRPEDNAILLSIENGMATAYLQDLRRNVMRGMRGKAERGWHVSKAPVGYLNDFESREIVPDPDRFGLVREGWDLLLRERLPVTEIHRRLTVRGLTIRRRGKDSGPISLSRIYDIFRCEFYTGKVVFKGEVTPGKHLPMITEDEFRAAHEILGRAGKSKTPEARQLPFANTFHCAVCGCVVCGEVKTKRFKRSGRVTIYTYYHCSGSRGCSKQSVRQEDLVATLKSVVGKIRMTDTTAGWLHDAVLASFENQAEGDAKGLSELERQRVEEEGRLRRLSRMRVDGEISSAEYADLRREITESIEEIHHAVHRLRDTAGRTMRHIRSRIDACVAAGEIDGVDEDPRVLAKVMKIAGGGLLNLFPFEFRIDPILEKIATFEPLRNGSEKPKRGDLLSDFPVWWAILGSNQ